MTSPEGNTDFHDHYGFLTGTIRVLITAGLCFDESCIAGTDMMLRRLTMHKVAVSAGTAAMYEMQDSAKAALLVAKP